MTMAFKTYKELVAMYNKNPEMAQKYVLQAEKEGRPVVSATNPGYNGGAKKSKATYYKQAIKNRLKAVPIKKNIEQEEITNRNKQVGY